MDKATDSSSSHQTTSANAATAGNHGGGTPEFGGGGDTPPQTHHVVNSNDNISVGCGPSTTNTNNICKQIKDGGNSGGVGGGSVITSANGSIVSACSSNSTPSPSSAVVASQLQRSITNGVHHHQHHHHISLLGAHNVTTLQHTAPPHAVPQPLINLNISTTTGGNFGVTVDPQISVENLKKIISKKLKVAKDRICLLHREKELHEGTLKLNNLMDGSKIILIPNVETGLLAQRPENTVMQALESLNDSQVNDFLSGKTPLNLSMRLGDHMMLIQLQLSTVNPVNSSNSVNGGTNCSSSSLRTRPGQRSSNTRTAASSTTAAAGGGSAAAHHNHHHHHHHHHHLASATSNSAVGTATATARKIDSRIATGGGATSSSSAAASVGTTTAIKGSDLSSFLSKRDYESLQNIVKSIAMSQPARLAAAAAASSAMNATALPVVVTQFQQQLPQQQQQTPNNTTTHTAAVVCPPPTTLAAAATNTRQTLRRTIMPLAASNTLSKSAFHVGTDDAVTAEAAASSEASATTALLEQSPIKSLSNLVSSPIKTTAIKNIPIANGTSSSCSPAASSHSSSAAVVTSVGSSAATTATSTLSKVATGASDATCQDPIAAKLTSCLCTRLNATGDIAAVNKVAAKRCIESVCLSRQERNIPVTHSRTPTMPTTPMPNTSTTNYKASAVQSPTAAAPASSCTSLLHKTTNNPISRSKHRHHHHHHHHHHHYHHHAGGSGSGTCGGAMCPNSCNSGATTALQRAPSSKQVVASNDSGFASDDSALTSNGAAASTPPTTVSTFTTSASSTTATTELDDSGIAASDTRTLAEASRNLTQTLRKLSKEVFTNKIDLSGVDDNSRKNSSGAVIESMKNHGKGIYSGTFSGTLNPALQDRYGRPKRDISTVIHILNDLLSATPQYSRGARISFEAPSTSSAAAAAASVAGTTANGAITSHGSRSKQISSKHHQHSHSCVKCVKTSHTHNTVSNHASACAYGECNGHYVKAKSNYACCQDLTTTATSGASSNASSSPTSNTSTNGNDRNTCICRYRIIDEATGEREREHTCQKCLVDMENSKTKSKLDQLRLVMQQRKQKREARKLIGSPYGARVVGAAATTTASVTTAAANNHATPMEIAPAASASTTSPTTPLNSGSSTLATPNDVSPNHIVEEVDTAA